MQLVDASSVRPRTQSFFARLPLPRRFRRSHTGTDHLYLFAQILALSDTFEATSGEPNGVVVGTSTLLSPRRLRHPLFQSSLPTLAGHTSLSRSPSRFGGVRLGRCCAPPPRQGRARERWTRICSSTNGARRGVSERSRCEYKVRQSTSSLVRFRLDREARRGKGARINCKRKRKSSTTEVVTEKLERVCTRRRG